MGESQLGFVILKNVKIVYRVIQNGQHVQNVKHTDHPGHIIVEYAEDVLKRWIIIARGKKKKKV